MFVGFVSSDGEGCGWNVSVQRPLKRVPGDAPNLRLGVKRTEGRDQG